MGKKQLLNNLFSGIIGQIITIGLGIILPRLFITNFGSEVNGLLSSVNQIYTYLGLLEAGVGTATLQALYKPIALNDKKHVNEILSATNLYYYKTGIFYGLAIFAFAFIYPIVIKTSISYTAVFLVILLSGLGNAIIFFFHGKYKILLNAAGKGYIVTNIATLSTILSSIIKIVLIINGFNVVIVQFSFFIINILQIFLFAAYIKTKYKWINIKEKPDYEAISKKNSVLIHQISYLVFSNTDIFLLTIFCDLKIVSVYALYNLIFSSISNLLGAFNNSVTYILGQTFQTNFKKFLDLVDCYELYYTAINFSAYTVTLVFILPFLKIYTNGISDANYLDYNLAILFIIISILISARTAQSNIINISGHFKETQIRSVIEMFINLIVSVICVIQFGIYGVLIGTITALLYRTNDIIIYSNRHILNRSPFRSYKITIINTLILLCCNYIYINFLSQLIKLNSFTALILNAIPITIIIMLIYFVINSILFRSSFKFLFNTLKFK